MILPLPRGAGRGRRRRATTTCWWSTTTPRSGIAHCGRCSRSRADHRGGPGAEALRILAERRPDLVMLDLNMPEPDGDGRARPDAPPTRVCATCPVVVVTSAYSPPPTTPRCPTSAVVLDKSRFSAGSSAARGRRRRPARREAAVSTGGRRARSPASVLVVDDNARQPLRRRAAGCAAPATGSIEAETGTEALAVLAAEPVDIVVLDVGLPDMSGFDVCERIKADPAHGPAGDPPVGHGGAAGRPRSGAQPRRGRLPDRAGRARRAAWRPSTPCCATTGPGRRPRSSPGGSPSWAASSTTCTPRPASTSSRARSPRARPRSSGARAMALVSALEGAVRRARRRRRAGAPVVDAAPPETGPGRCSGATAARPRPATTTELERLRAGRAGQRPARPRGAGRRDRRPADGRRGRPCSPSSARPRRWPPTRCASTPRNTASP